MRATIVRGLGVGLLASILTMAMLIPNPIVALASSLWTGTAAVQVSIRSEPSSDAPVIGVLEQGDPVTVDGWVSGDEIETQNNTWAHLDEGGYVYSARLHKDPPEEPPPLPDGTPYQGRWIDANVTQQVLTAYVGSTPVHVAVMSSGRPDYPTPEGNFTILRRVENETMDSSSLPWVRDSYRLENVLFTQYFTNLGAAIHEAWWKADDSFGIPTSHACMGLPYDEALWFWNWADVGVPVYVHE